MANNTPTEEDIRSACAGMHNLGEGDDVCDGCEDGQVRCTELNAMVKRVLKSKWFCDNEHSFYYGVELESPLQVHEDCYLSAHVNMRCSDCSHVVQVVSPEDTAYLQRRVL